MRLRLATPDDAAAILAIYEPLVRETAISFEYEPPSADEIARRIATTLVGWPYLVAEIEGAIAGYAYAGAFRTRTAYQWSAETSVYVSPDHHRCGVARALYEALIDMMVRSGFHVAWAGITLPNDASVAFHESLGFARIGTLEGVGFKFGRWHDVGLWRQQIAPGDPVDPSRPPLTPTQLAATDRWPQAIDRPV